MYRKPIEELRMTEEEMKQYTDRALIKFLMLANSSRDPRVAFIVGQPGARKNRACYSLCKRNTTK